MKFGSKKLLGIALLVMMPALSAASVFASEAEGPLCCSGSKHMQAKVGCNLGDWAEEFSGAWLGVELQDLDAELKEAMDLGDRDGVLVSDVVEDSPAEKAGLKAGDVIFKINDREIRNSSKLAKYIRKQDPGDEVEIYYLRDGKEKEKKVKLGEQEHPLRKLMKIRGNRPDMRVMKIGSGPRLGISVQEMDKDLAEYFEVKEGDGVLVSKVMTDSPAEKAGIKSGDVILKVADKEIGSAGDIRSALSDFEEGDKVKVQLFRKGRSKVLEVEIEDDSSFDVGSLDILPFTGDDFHGEPFLYKHRVDLDDKEDLRDELQDLKDELRKLREELERVKKSGT